jgi:hypothetical protein
MSDVVSYNTLIKAQLQVGCCLRQGREMKKNCVIPPFFLNKISHPETIWLTREFPIGTIWDHAIGVFHIRGMGLIVGIS